MSGKRPIFILAAAISLDGKITQGNKEGSEWTSAEDKKFFQAEMDRSDAVVMGRKTFDAIKRPLKPRNRIVFTHSVIPASLAESRRAKAGIQTPLFFHGSKEKLLALLQENNWTRIAIVGGTSIYDWFLERNLIDEMYLTLEPVLFGAGKLLSAQALENRRKYRLISVKKLNKQGTLLLHYRRIL